MPKPSFTSSSSSSDSSASEEVDFFLPYNKRPEWADIHIQLDEIIDTDSEVVVIPFSIKFRHVFAYFQEILQRDEMSERALNLTTDCIELNPANFTVWDFRKKLLTYLKKDLSRELDYLENIIFMSPKNYQVWHHRQWAIKDLLDKKDDFTFIQKVLNNDPKNYHAWQYLKMINDIAKRWEKSYEFTTKMIEEDFRNNSAWSHRFYALSQLGKLDDPKFLENEIEYTISKIKKAPSNESSWNYLRGILKEKLTGNASVNQMCEELYSNSCKSNHLYSFMIDSIEECLENSESYDQDLVEKAAEMANLMKEKYDKIRGRYWEYIEKRIRENYKSKSE